MSHGDGPTDDRGAGAARPTLLVRLDAAILESPAEAATLLAEAREDDPRNRELAAREAALELLHPEAHHAWQAIRGDLQPESAGGAHAAAVARGSARRFATLLGHALAEDAGQAALARGLRALAAGSARARRLAAAVLAAPVELDLDEAGRAALLRLVGDPSQAVWPLAAAAWGRRAASDAGLAASLREALSAPPAATGGARTRGAADPWRLSSTEVLEPRPGAAPTRRPGARDRRPLAALVAWADAEPDAVVATEGGEATTEAHARSLLDGAATDPWDRATAVLGLLAWDRPGDAVADLAARARRLGLPAASNLARVALETEPSSLSADTGPGDLVDVLGSAAPSPLVLDGAVALADAARAAGREVALDRPVLRGVAHVRAALFGPPEPADVADATGETPGSARAACLAEVASERKRLDRLVRRARRADAAVPWRGAVEERARALSHATLRVGGVPSDAGWDALQEPLLNCLGELATTVEELLEGEAGRGGRHRLEEALWVLCRVAETPWPVDADSLKDARCLDLHDRFQPAALTELLLSWSRRVMPTGDSSRLLPLLRAAERALAVPSQPFLTTRQALIDLLASPMPAAADMTRPLSRLLARLVAPALDAVAASDSAATRAELRELALATMGHALWSEGLAEDLDARLCTPDARALLAEVAETAPVMEGRAAALSAAGSEPGGEPPGTIDGFLIAERLGRGGFGVVYACESARHGRVAVKVCHDLERARGRGFRRFLDEAVLLGRLHHPAIPRLVALGQHGGYPYIAMELVEGTTLLDRLRDGRLARAEASRILLALIDVLRAVHAQGVRHRDLKPGNVMLGAGGTVKVLDWGLGHCPAVAPGGMTVRGGTPPYAAPEQYRPEGVADESYVDHFALGCIAIELLTGSPLSALGPPHPPARDARGPVIDEVQLREEGVEEDFIEAIVGLTEQDVERRVREFDVLEAACRARGAG